MRPPSWPPTCFAVFELDPGSGAPTLNLPALLLLLKVGAVWLRLLPCVSRHRGHSRQLLE
jgi:hypothetical protein